MCEKFGSKPENLFVFVGPSITQKNYEVGREVAGKFDERYSKCLNGKICLDVLQANVDLLIDCEIPRDQVEISPLCSYEEKNLLHSYRRDGELSGRSLGVLAIKES
jgi:copper oxidase (laccase) domain-containing protein